jgi:hypothetical protein
LKRELDGGGGIIQKIKIQTKRPLEDASTNHRCQLGPVARAAAFPTSPSDASTLFIWIRCQKKNEKKQQRKVSQIIDYK